MRTRLLGIVRLTIRLRTDARRILARAAALSGVFPLPHEDFRHAHALS